MTEPVLILDNLSVSTVGRDAGRPILQEITFDVRRGETLCVVGESGSGKSVTGLSVMGLLPKGSLAPTSGRIMVGGEPVLTARESRLRALRATEMAMVFQEPMTALNPVQSVGRQIDEVLRLHTRLGRRERYRKVLDMLRSVHMPDAERVYHSYPHQLSGGQRQRVMISMALILDPKLLIADEPTTALDVTTQKQILQLIRELQETHDTAVMFITHDFGVVAEIADRIVVMNAGRVVEEGSRWQLLRNPREDYTRMLISSVPSLIPRHTTQPDGRPILEVKNLTKIFTEQRIFRRRREVKAAQDVSLAVRKAEIVGIVGESGSGKSTVARCIVRLIDPSSGEISVDGQNIALLPAKRLRHLRRKFQIVFQDPYRSLNPRRRIRDSLAEGLINFGMTRADAKRETDKLLMLVGLEPAAAERYPHQFSGGQRQRICIARALALKPDLLIADEAVSALDVSIQAQILDLLNDIRDRLNVGILFITHDLRVAAQLCHQIVVMQEGRIVEVGPVGDVLTDPKCEYTRELINAAPGRGWDFKNFRPVKLVN
jgi:peptide/nickel transport system ATP-binding protein